MLTHGQQGDRLSSRSAIVAGQAFLPCFKAHSMHVVVAPFGFINLYDVDVLKTLFAAWHKLLHAKGILVMDYMTQEKYLALHAKGTAHPAPPHELGFSLEVHPTAPIADKSAMLGHQLLTERIYFHDKHDIDAHLQRAGFAIQQVKTFTKPHNHPRPCRLTYFATKPSS